MLQLLNTAGKSLGGLLRVLPVVGMLSCSSLALADDATDEAPIIVTGTATTKKQVSDFVGALTATRYNQQLARFERPICPRVAGLSEVDNLAVAERMRRVAQAAGVQTASGKCSANILVMVTPDKAAFIEKFAVKYPYFMRDLPKSKRKAMLKSDAPAAVWHFNGALIGPDGAEITELLDDFLINRTTERASIISDPTHPQYSGAVVVVESGAAGWLSSMQLADYALLRALLNADPEKLPNSDIPTILSILDAKSGEEVPASITQWDLETIRAFYTVNRVLPATQQRSRISGEILKKLAEASEGSN